MKKEYRRGLNFTREQVFYLDLISRFSDLSFAKVVRDMVDEGINDTIAVIKITTQKGTFVYDFVKDLDYVPVVNLMIVPKPSKKKWESILNAKGNAFYFDCNGETFYTQDIIDYEIITIKEYFSVED